MLYELIKNYKPSCEQEKCDKDLMLYCLSNFDDCLTRENKLCHFTASSFIVNEDKNKVIMIYHNIYNSWAWVGGHADGEENLLNVCLKEIEEETGLKKVIPILNDPISIQALPVDSHVKRGKFISSHIHLDCCFICEASEKELLRINEDESSGIKWVPIDEVVNLSNEKNMKPIYQKIVDKIKKIKDLL